MNKFKLAVGVMFVFLAGAVAGSFGTGMYFNYRTHRFAGGGPPPRLRKVFLVRRLSDELKLTDAQRNEIEKIVEESEARMLAVRRQYLPEIKEITDQSFALMKKKLNADQQEKLERLREKIQNRYARAFINSITAGKKPEETLSKLKKRLNLTQEQVNLIRPIIEEDFERRVEMVEKYGTRDRPEINSLRREVRELQKFTEKSIVNILTKEQMGEYREIQQEERLKRRRKWGRLKFGHLR